VSSARKKEKKTPTMKKIIWMVKKRFTIHMNSDNSKNNAKKKKILHVNSAKKKKTKKNCKKWKTNFM
jgi:5S rRNA maturation endonuclease (ribonuclease M5)